MAFKFCEKVVLLEAHSLTKLRTDADSSHAPQTHHITHKETHLNAVLQIRLVAISPVHENDNDAASPAEQVGVTNSTDFVEG